MWTGRRRATRGFLAAAAAAVAVPAVAVGWLGWQLLAQDRVLEQQRVRDRLATAADLAAAALARVLSAEDERLAAVIEAPDPSRALTSSSTAAADDAVVVVVSDHNLSASVPLPYYPIEARFDDPVADRFADAERIELADRKLERALAIYSALAASGDRAVRAGALARAARAARNLDRPEDALAAYAELARLGSASTLGRPADLVASIERLAVLNETGQHDRLILEARDLERRLLAGEWRLSRGQFAFYRERANEWLDETGPDAGRPVTETEALAAGVLAAWQLVGNDRPPAASDRGRQLFDNADWRGLVLWRRSAAGTAAFVATPAYLEHVWTADIRAIEERQRVRPVRADSRRRRAMTQSYHYTAWRRQSASLESCSPSRSSPH